MLVGVAGGWGVVGDVEDADGVFCLGYTREGMLQVEFG